MMVHLNNMLILLWEHDKLKMYSHENRRHWRMHQFVSQLSKYLAGVEEVG